MILYLSVAALAADVHQCTSTATGPGGATYEVTGFGSSEAEAWHGAEQSGRLIGSQSTLRQGIQAWLGGTPEEQAGVTATLTKGTESLAVPGWKLKKGACQVVKVEDGASYTSTWIVGSEETRRPTPAMAIEASRRRACLPMYQRNLMQVLDEVLKQPEAATKLSQLDGTFSEFAACWTGTPPTASPHAEPIPSEGPARCSAIDGTGSPVAVGFGESPEAAAEQAIRQSVFTRTQATISTLAKAYADHPTADARRAQMEPALRALVGISGPSDAVDRSRLACASVTPSALTWWPPGATAKACNAASWTERPKTVVEPSAAATFLDGTCHLQVSPTFEIVRFASRDAEPERLSEMLTSAYRVTGMCSSNCYATANWGTAPTPVTLHGAPDRTSQKAVLDALVPLTEGKSLTGLELLPTLQDPAALGELLSGEIGKRLRDDLKALPSKAERWKQIDGNWILLP